MTAPNLTQVPPLLWSPSTETQKDTELYKFIDFINLKHSLKIADYNTLYLWSVTYISDFWASVWEFTQIKSSSPYVQVVDEAQNMETVPKWFEGARLNYAENILKWADVRGDEVAVYGSGEGQEKVSKLTWNQLKAQVTVVAHKLKEFGVGRGDRVVGYISNCPEAIVAMLATTSLGAIWSSTSPDFGPKAVLDRFSQIEPKVIFTVNAIVYNGKTHDHLKKVAEVTKNLPTLEKVIVIPFVPTYTMDLTSLDNNNALPYTDLFNNSEAVPELAYEQVSFDHPVYILFSSGTTGVPKCLVHSVGGMIIQHKKEHQLHGNLGPKDILLQYTTAGWMMWNWLIGALLVGSSIVTYDGSPFRPDPFVLFRLMEEVGVTAFGTSAKYIQSLQDQPLIPREHHKLPTLHSIYSTGSPLKPEDYEYTYKSIHPNVCLGSITGGTDICSLFGAHNINLPVYRGEIQCIGLGMKVESWTHTNTPVFDIPGDLVCTAAFPCMPVYLWKDPDNVKYRAAYFDTFPGVWCQGDYVQIGGQTGGLLMLGRSDGTLNPSGVRFGSAEIYNTLDIFPEIEDSVVIGQKIKDDERVILFIKTKEGYEFGQDLITRVKTHIRQVLSPRHVPSIILPTTDIPYTVNGKKVEVAVKKIINGYPLDKVEKGTLINPDSLALYHNLPELKIE